MKDQMTIVIGIILIILSIIIVLLGDKKLEAKEGKISKAVSMPSLNIKFVKWACGIISFCFGLCLIIWK